MAGYKSVSGSDDGQNDDDEGWKVDISTLHMSRRALTCLSPSLSSGIARPAVRITRNFAAARPQALYSAPNTNLFPAAYTTSAAPSKMKAILIKDGKGPAENLYLGEEATPEPKKGEVQVKVS